MGVEPGTKSNVNSGAGRTDGQKGSDILLSSTSQMVRVENGRRDQTDTHLLHLTLSKYSS
jgi:hypothetical protein